MLQNFQPDIIGNQFNFTPYNNYGTTSSPYVVPPVTQVTPPRTFSSYKTPPPGGKRERTKFTSQQLSYLEQHFVTCQYPQGPQREKLAQELNLTDVKVQVWFKNRRAKLRQRKKFEDEVRKGNNNGGTSAPETEANNNTTDVEAPVVQTVAQPPPEPSPPTLSATMPMLTLTPNLDMAGIKLDPLTAASNDALLQDASALNMAQQFPGNPGAHLQPAASGLNGQFTNWMTYPNIFGQYPQSFNFSPYPYQNTTAVASAPYDYSGISAAAAPQYYMNATTPRADLPKF